MISKRPLLAAPHSSRLQQKILLSGMIPETQDSHTNFHSIYLGEVAYPSLGSVFKIISLVSKEMSVSELLVKVLGLRCFYLWDSLRAASAYAFLLGNN